MKKIFTSLFLSVVLVSTVTTNINLTMNQQNYNTSKSMEQIDNY